MAVAKCGGLKFNPQQLKLINGILTTIDKTSVDSWFNASYCGGQLFDADVFKEVRVGDQWVIALINGDPSEYIVANCSIRFDANDFTVGNDRALNLEHYEPSDYIIIQNGSLLIIKAAPATQTDDTLIIV